jgi:long-subunit acyl-CoA synthetase (AMP-forming)
VPGSAGRLLPGVRARLVDPETGADVGTGGTGELLVRSPALMTGYLGNAAATAATIDREGWLHTGDIARFDADGNLFLIDRIKDLIKVPRRLLASPVPHSAHQRMTQGEAT